MHVLWPFVRLVRKITADAPRGCGLRWQRDALVALQLASEDFLVMIFEMTYVPTSSCLCVLINRNRLALHARRVTVMPKDMRLLRDLWRYIAPEHVIAKASLESLEAVRRANLHDEVLKQRSRASALTRYKALQSLNQPIPCQLEHFCKDLERSNTGLLYRRSSYRQLK
jgi:histone H3/H4